MPLLDTMVMAKIVFLLLAGIDLAVSFAPSFKLTDRLASKVLLSASVQVQKQQGRTTPVDHADHLGLTNPPISLFGKGSVATSNSKQILGGKGANLAVMSSIGLAVPPGFTITTECCQQFCGDWEQTIPPSIWNEIVDSLKSIEEAMGSEFGSETNPLLLSGT
jgi:hypothetical protein